jgi:pSer/pThr/pTyr-binding forkhead associated (FHA) protein
MWILESSGRDREPVTFRLSAGVTKTIGRAAQADFVIDAPLVSRVHCRLEANDQALGVVDLSSTNGTYVNDERIERARLRAGDRLRVGRMEFLVAEEP